MLGTVQGRVKIMSKNEDGLQFSNTATCQAGKKLKSNHNYMFVHHKKIKLI